MLPHPLIHPPPLLPATPLGFFFFLFKTGPPFRNILVGQKANRKLWKRKICQVYSSSLKNGMLLTHSSRKHAYKIVTPLNPTFI